MPYRVSRKMVPYKMKSPQNVVPLNGGVRGVPAKNSSKKGNVYRKKKIEKEKKVRRKSKK